MRSIQYIIIIFVAIFIVVVVVFLYDKNENNIINPNDFQNVRILHVKSNTYVALRLAPAPDGPLTVAQTDKNPFFHCLAIGGNANEETGLWNFYSNNNPSNNNNPNGEKVYRIQSFFTRKYTSDLQQIPTITNPVFGLGVEAVLNNPPTHDKGWLKLVPTASNPDIPTGSSKSFGAIKPLRFNIILLEGNKGLAKVGFSEVLYAVDGKGDEFELTIPFPNII